MSESRPRFVFPRWANYLLPAIVLGGVGGALYVPVLLGFGASPRTTAVGYAPEQPVPFSHALHAGKLGMDCRYCHSTVEKAAFAAIPPTQTCMNCHTNIKPESEKLLPIRESWASGRPVPWVKIHDQPDYVYFNHAAHVNKGVACVTCHGRIDQMEVVQQAQPMSMSWCLECHNGPEKYLRPKEQVTNMDYRPENDPTLGEKYGINAGSMKPEELQLTLGRELKKQYGVHDTAYMTSCYTCHR